MKYIKNILKKNSAGDILIPDEITDGLKTFGYPDNKPMILPSVMDWLKSDKGISIKIGSKTNTSTGITTYSGIIKKSVNLGNETVTFRINNMQWHRDLDGKKIVRNTHDEVCLDMIVYIAGL